MSKTESYDRLLTDWKMVFDYCNAMVSLYGRISVKEAFGIIQRQNDAAFSYDEFKGFLWGCHVFWERCNAKHEGRFCLFKSADKADLSEIEIVHECFGLDDNGGSYITLVEEQKNKPLYLPSKRELLKYKDDEYYEDSKELQNVVNWILKHRQKNKEFAIGAKDIASEVTLALIMDSDSLGAMRSAVRWIDLPSNRRRQEQSLTELMELMISLHNNTRMWFLRGHTPREIETICGK